MKKIFTLYCFAVSFLSQSSLLAQGVVYVDGFDYPMGSRGYNTAGNPVPILEHISSETNNIYPNGMAVGVIRRGNEPVTPFSNGDSRWFNIQDVGNWFSLNNGHHSGEDWVWVDAGIDQNENESYGQNIYAVANGIVIQRKNFTNNNRGFEITLKHLMPNGDIVYSQYTHIASPLVNVGDVVVKGQLISSIAHTTDLDHLHFQMMLNNPNFIPPNYSYSMYTGNPNCINTSTSYYYNTHINPNTNVLTNCITCMTGEGIIDPSDFIDNHRTIAGCTDNYEPNNSFTTAHNLNSGNPFSNTNTNQIIINSAIATGNDADIYRVGMDGKGVMTISLTNLPADYDMELYGLNGTGPAIGYGDNTGTSSENIIKNQSLNISTEWYIKIYPKNSSQFNSCTQYKLTVNWQPDNTSFVIPPGNMKTLLLSGLELSTNDNDLIFMFQGIPCGPGDPPINKVAKAEGIKKMFKQALAVPEFKHWISLDVNNCQSGNCVGDATYASPFQNTDLIDKFYQADVEMKFDMFTTPLAGTGLNTGTEYDWTQNVMASPYLSQIQSSGYDYYPAWLVRAAIESDNLNFSSQGTNKIIINDAQMTLDREVIYTSLDFGGSGLSNQIKNHLNSLCQGAYKNQLLQRLNNGASVTLPKINSTGPEYQAIREAYRITAAAHWYRSIGNSNKPFQNIINSNNLTGFARSSSFNEPYWDSQAWQYLATENATHYLGYTGSWDIWGGVVLDNPTLINAGNFSSTQNTIDTLCFQNKGIANIGSETYFYAGGLDIPTTELNGIFSKIGFQKNVKQENVTVQVTIFNTGNKASGAFKVRLYEQNTSSPNILIQELTITNLDSFSSQNLDFVWIPQTTGYKQLKISIDEINQVIEKKKSNNVFYDSTYVYSNIPTVIFLTPQNSAGVVNKNLVCAVNVIDNIDNVIQQSNITWKIDNIPTLLTGNVITIDTLIPGLHTIKCTATNSKGYSSSDEVTVFAYPQGVPLLSLLSPTNGDTISSGVNILLQATANDLNDGNISQNIIWKSQLGDTIGYGGSLNHSFNAGTHTLTALIANTSGNISTTSVNIVAINGTPTISIGSPATNSTYQQHQTISFSGGSMDYPDGNISNSIHWTSSIDGALGTGSLLNHLLSIGTHIITATVTDSHGQSVSSTITINILPTPPVATIASPLANSTYLFHIAVTLTGNATDVQDGILSGTHLQWFSSLQGLLGTGNNLTLTNLVYGTHVISLKATDNDGAYTTVTVQNIFIEAGLPTVSMTAPVNNSSHNYGMPIVLSGIGNDPQNGTLSGTSLQWSSSIDGNIGTGNSVILSTLSVGTHVIRLTATDTDEFSQFTERTISIMPPHNPQIAITQPASNVSILNGNSITLYATASDYEDGTLGNNRVSWSSNISGNLGTGLQKTMNLSIGVHTITATATDTLGATTSATRIITVNQNAPVVNILSPINFSAYAQNTNITFTATATDYEDGTLSGTSIKWYSAGSLLGTGNPFVINSLSVGTNQIQCIVTDSGNGKDTATVFVNIQGVNNYIVSKFNNNKDSIVKNFTLGGSDTTVYFSIPKNATVQSANAVIQGKVNVSDIQIIWQNIIGSIGGGNDVTDFDIDKGSQSVYITGAFGGSATFAGNTLVSSGGSDIFVAKYNNNGALIWAIKAGGLGGDIGSGITVDSIGNCYVTGSITGSATFGGITISGLTDADGFIAKYDSNGTIQWVKRIWSNTNESDFGNKVIIDNGGNINICGRTYAYPTTTYLNVGASIFPINAHIGYPMSGFLLKLNTSGGILGCNTFHGNAFGISSCINSNDLYVYGSFKGNNCLFGPNSLSSISTNYNDCFICKYDSSGNMAWAVNAAGGSNEDAITGIGFDAQDNIYLSGMTQSNPLMLNGGFSLTTNATPTLYQVFFAKLNNNGQTIWAYSFPNNVTYFSSLHMSKRNQPVLWGNNGIPNTNYNGITVNSGNYLIEFDSIGNGIWYKQVTVSHQKKDYLSDYTYTLNNGIAKYKDITYSFPYNPYFDVSNNGTHEWSQTGKFNSTQIIPNFASEINTYLSTAVPLSNGIVNVPIKIQADSGGVIVLKNLNIQYQFIDTIKPNLTASILSNPVIKNSNYIITAIANDNMNIANVKVLINDTLHTMTNTIGSSYTYSASFSQTGIYPIKIIATDVIGLTKDTTINLNVIETGKDVRVMNVTYSNLVPVDGSTLQIQTTVKNFGTQPCNASEIVLKANNNIVSTLTTNIASNETKILTFNWVASLGTGTLSVVADPNNLLSETNESNNILSQVISVQDIIAPTINSATITPNPIYVGQSFLVQIDATDNVAIGIVSAAFDSVSQNLVFNNSLNKYETSFTTSTVGNYNITCNVGDTQGLSTQIILPIQVLNAGKDLYLNPQNIHVDTANNQILLTVSNLGNQAISNFQIRVSNANTIITQNASIAGNTNQLISVPWSFGCGTKTISISLDPNNLISETDETNNQTNVTTGICLPAVTNVSLSISPNPVLSNTATTVLLLSTDSSFASVLLNGLGTLYNLTYNHINGYSTTIVPTLSGNYPVTATAINSSGLSFILSDSIHVLSNLPDVTITDAFIQTFPVAENTTNSVLIKIANPSGVPVNNLQMKAFLNGIEIDNFAVSIPATDTIQQTIAFIPNIGNDTLLIIADPSNVITETNENNNSKQLIFNAIDNEAPVFQFIGTNTPLYSGNNMLVTCEVTDNVQVASVMMLFNGQTYTLNYNASSQQYTVNIPSVPQGSGTLHLTATDINGIQATALYNIIVNNNQPDLTISPFDIEFINAPVNMDTIKVMIHNNGGSMATNASLQIKVDNNIISTQNANIAAGQTNTFVTTYTGSYATHTITAIADYANTIVESNEGNNTATFSFNIWDNVAPTIPVVTVIPSIWTNGNSFNLSWLASTDNDAIASYEYRLNNGNWINVGNVLSTSFTSNLEGISNVYVRAKDVSGNMSDAGVAQIMVDTTPPNAPIITEEHCGKLWTTHNSPYLQWLMDGDVGSGINHYEISIDAQTPINIGNVNFYHPTLASGIHQLKLRGIDNVGLTGTWSNIDTVLIDVDAPPSPVITSPTHPNQNQWYQNDSIVLEITRPSDLSGVTGYFWALSNDSSYVVSNSNYWYAKDTLTITKIPSMDSNFVRIPDGIWYIHLIAKDSVGNYSTAVSYRFKIDKTAPESHYVMVNTSQVDTIMQCPPYALNFTIEDYPSQTFASFHYSFDGVNFLSANLSMVNITSLGFNKVYFYSVDSSGNFEAIDSISIYLAGTDSLFISTPALGCGALIPIIVDLSFKFYIEGFYVGSGLMNPVLMNQGILPINTICDIVIIELHAASAPYNVISAQTAFLNTNGNGTCQFSINKGYYYIVLKHRNGLQTWSANPVLFVNSVVSYDYTTSSNKAYGNNMTEVDSGVWAIYNGELNNDENIDLLDLGILESGINSFQFGYYSTDLNGDGNVDLLDSPMLESNVNNFIFSNHP